LCVSYVHNNIRKVGSRTSGRRTILRPHDEADFVALVPLLAREERAWLREAVSRVYDGEHPWVGRLFG